MSNMLSGRHTCIHTHKHTHTEDSDGLNIPGKIPKKWVTSAPHWERAGEGEFLNSMECSLGAHCREDGAWNLRPVKLTAC